MTRRAAPLLILIGALLSGCISAYRYESRGAVESARGERRGALLYYYEDDGRLWYGKPYRARDSDADLRVCGATDATFVPTSESELLLALKSRGGDERVAGLAAEGGLVAVSPPVTCVVSRMSHSQSSAEFSVALLPTSSFQFSP